SAHSPHPARPTFPFSLCVFFFNVPPPPEIYTLSLHDALPISDLHVVGKNITRFHCIIWPAMLLAADLPLPRAVRAHGFVLWEGTKMSKTAGTAVTLGEAIDRHGADALRYFLLREVGFESDGEFTWERFDARYTSEL